MLALTDLGLSVSTLPTMVGIFWFNYHGIYFGACQIQMFCIHSFSFMESAVLLVMSFDRFVAICHPLRYPVLMRDNFSGLLAAGSWLVGILNSIVHTAFVLHFPFCHSRAIDHFFCEVPAMLKLSCIDTTHYERGVYVSGIIFLLIPFSMISISYVQILLTVFQMQSSGARQKSFSTCSFHMVVVIMYYGPFIFTYMRPRSYHTPGQDRYLRLFGKHRWESMS